MQADKDCFVEDGSLEDNFKSSLSLDDTSYRDVVGRSMDVSKGVVNDILIEWFISVDLPGFVGLFVPCMYLIIFWNKM